MRLLGCYILKDRTPVRTRNLARWSWWVHGPDSETRRRVAYTEIDEVRVSTVFTGFDTGIDRPELFETMIFGGLCDGVQWRYATWDDAETGHAVAVELVRRTQNMPQDDGGGTDAEATRDIPEGGRVGGAPTRHEGDD